MTGQLLRQGDSVRTGTGGHAAVTFFDQSVIVLEPSTDVEVVSLRAVNSGDIDVTLRQSSGKTCDNSRWGSRTGLHAVRAVQRRHQQVVVPLLPVFGAHLERAVERWRRCVVRSGHGTTFVRFFWAPNTSTPIV